MAAPPLVPFPFDEFFRDVDDWEQFVAFFNDPTLDAAQLNTKYGGYLPSWQHAQAAWGAGLATDSSFVNLYMPYRYVIGGVPYYYTSGANMLDEGILEPAVLARHVSTNQRIPWDNFGPILTGPVVSYPGAFTTHAGSSGANNLEPVWMNAPISYEMWFSENPDKVTPFGFTGYPIYMYTYSAAVPSLTGDLLPSDIYIRRKVVGVIKQAADLTTCTPSDVMCGIIINYTGTNTTVDVCVNGVSIIQRSYAGTVHPFDEYAYIYTRWDTKQLAEFYGNSGAVRDMGGAIYVGGSPDYFDVTQYPSSDPDYVHVEGFDTYDTKFAWLVDYYTPSLAVGTTVPVAVGNSYLSYVSATTPSMFTLPGRYYPPTPDFWQSFINTREET